MRMSPNGRLCCKSLKTPGDEFPARRRNKPQSLLDVASGSLPKSPVSFITCDEVPHISTRKPRLQPEKFAINGAKRLLQHNRHNASIRCGAKIRKQSGAKRTCDYRPGLSLGGRPRSAGGAGIVSPSSLRKIA